MNSYVIKINGIHEVVYTGTREDMCKVMEILNEKGFASLRSEEDATTCHFCGTYVKNGYEIGPDRRNRHWLSDCRPDLVEHEPGEICTWSGCALTSQPKNCYAYQNRFSNKWEDEHKHFYPDGPVG